MTKKYTLDRIENDMYVLLEYPKEERKLLIPINNYSGQLAEGDLVLIQDEMIVEVLKQETNEMEEKVSGLLEKLKNKK